MATFKDPPTRTLTGLESAARAAAFDDFHGVGESAFDVFRVVVIFNQYNRSTRTTYYHQERRTPKKLVQAHIDSANATV